MSRHIKALVVEDEIKIGDYIKNKIEYLDSGFRVQGVAENGKQALEMIKKSQPQVVFTDISMPEMDGLELSRLIRNTYPEVLVVIISGYSDFEYAQKAIRYGVFNYLLKPLEDEKLSDVLIDIRKTLMNEGNGRERALLYSDGYVLHKEGAKYIILYVCVGNMIYDVRERKLTEHYRRAMEEIPWRAVMDKLCGETYAWYLADEYACNQKVCGIQLPGEPAETPEDVAGRLLELLQGYTHLAVHMILAEKPMEYEKVWSRVKQFRFLMQKKLAAAKTQLLVAERQTEHEQNVLEIVKIKVNSYMKNYFISTDLKGFGEEIQKVLQYMMQNDASQQEIEKVCLYVIKLLEFSDKSGDSGFLEEMERRMQVAIGLSETEEELNGRMMECFREIERYMEQLYEKKMESRVLEYVDRNFLTLESLEQVADVFGYNYTYLSRLFKKMAGMSMNKYIAEKKMNMAKRLLKENPGMRIEEICELCGYSDCRYFGRVFKNQFGVTPSEYRCSDTASDGSLK